MTTRKKLILVLALLVPVLAAAILFALATSEPPVYVRAGDAMRRPAAREAALREFDEKVFNHTGNVLLDQSGGTRLDVTITEPMVNARIRQYLDEAARSGGRVPPEIATLRVGFEPGCMVLATRVGRGVFSVIASQEVRFRATEEGFLAAEMGELRAGRLPVPSGLAEKLRSGLQTLAARVPVSDEEQGPADLWWAAIGALDGQPVPLGHGKKRIAIDRLQIERGSLHIEGHRTSAERGVRSAE